MTTMARQNVERLLVFDGPQMLGIVTRGDLMRTIRTRQELAR
jgi:signal-transduction protein with cAMP-binding, CBS, and nucleotidyltransferase domain